MPIKIGNGIHNIFGGEDSGNIHDYGSGRIITTTEREKLNSLQSSTVDSVGKDANFNAELETTYIVNNLLSAIQVTLPSFSSLDIGKEIRLIVAGNTHNHNVDIVSYDATQRINGVSSILSHNVKARLDNTRFSYHLVKISVVSQHDWFIFPVDDIFNERVYFAEILTTSNNEWNYLNFNAPVANFLTPSNDWWFACKIQDMEKNKSEYQALMCSDQFKCALRIDGLGIAVGDELINFSSQTTLTRSNWLIVSYKASNNSISVYVNGYESRKLINEHVLTNTFTNPTETYFGYETQDFSSFYHPLNRFRISNLMLDTNTLDESKLSNFAIGTSKSSHFTDLIPSNEWTFNSSGTVTENGTTDITPIGSILYIEK